MEKKFMYVDDIAVELNGEKNVLEVIRKAGIDMPTLCYHPELSIYGACRMCMFENERGGLDAACSAQPRAGMKVYTPKGSASIARISSSCCLQTIAATATPAKRTETANFSSLQSVTMFAPFVSPTPQRPMLTILP